jgi:Zn finger protein HypA/HybF involved in hydrogenase expression
MTDWAPLVNLQASEARKQLAERALQQKQEEARRAEQLARGKDKAQEEDRALKEAIRLRIKREGPSFRCHCCRQAFSKPLGAPVENENGVQIIGIIVLLVAIFAGLSTGLGLVGTLLLGLAGLAMYWGPEIRSRLPSLCPNCKSTNFSRPEKTDEQK